MENKAEHAVQSYAAGVGGLGAWGYGLYLQYANNMTEHSGFLSTKWGKFNVT